MTDSTRRRRIAKLRTHPSPDGVTLRCERGEHVKGRCTACVKDGRSTKVYRWGFETWEVRP